LITKSHIEALSNINRFNGWTRRPYSVLEHTVIGTHCALRTGMSENVAKAFMLHDMEEAVFGDIIRPIKKRLMNDAYFEEVDSWTQRLTEWVGCDAAASCLTSIAVKTLDDDMLAAEIETVATISDPDHPFDEIRHYEIAEMIRSEQYRGRRAIDAFEHLWFGMFPNAEIAS
jgi:hypothetical protein